MRHTREADSQKLEVFSLAPAQHLRVISAAQMPGNRTSGGTPAVQNQPRTFAERAERFTGCHEQEIKKRGRFRQSHNTVQVSAAIRINPSTLLAPKTAFRVHEAPSFCGCSCGSRSFHKRLEPVAYKHVGHHPPFHVPTFSTTGRIETCLRIEVYVLERNCPKVEKLEDFLLCSSGGRKNEQEKCRSGTLFLLPCTRSWKGTASPSPTILELRRT